MPGKDKNPSFFFVCVCVCVCNKVLLKYKGDRESFWHRHQKGLERVPLNAILMAQIEFMYSSLVT